MEKTTVFERDLPIVELPDEVAICLEKDLSMKCTAPKKQPGHGLFLWEVLGKSKDYNEKRKKKQSTCCFSDLVEIYYLESIMMVYFTLC